MTLELFGFGLMAAALLLYLTHRLEKAMTVNTDKLTAATDRLSVSIATELRQLADAMTSSDAPAQAIVDGTAEKLNALADQLDADDAPPAPTPEAEHPEG